MVLLTMTPSIVEALAKRKPSDEAETEQPEDSTTTSTDQSDEPKLENPAVGNPISHGQIVDLWKQLRGAGEKVYTLENLLRGAKVYVPPPPPKPEPSPEYKALMARLRREEEQRAYERMTHPPPQSETFSSHFPNSSSSLLAHSFAEVNRPTHKSDTGDDDVSYNDVHRQLMLLLNFVVSILGVAGTLWVVARWWSTPARLFLTMAGSAVVGIAEVAVYQGYLWHLGEAKKKDGKAREVREVVRTWVVGSEEEKKEKDAVRAGGGGERAGDVDLVGDGEVRRRKKETS
ncbi:endoplasmic reticulum-based factor for assembly of V-ATPase-domain-containing protein [Coniochaeta sp. 2T2.1]|nr:endoplasmic reticulum-based factor for assembly of V-ATPase-domain-containing protein [Coniochaeta sp. 2T2.1]